MNHAPVVIVSGASRGIGAWVARCLGKLGTSVIIVARSGEGLSGVARDIEAGGGRALTVVGDVSDPQVPIRAVASAVSRFGQIHAIVNNAGIYGPISPIADADPERWESNIRINLMAPFYLAKAAIPELRKTKGRIVNVSSGAATIPIAAASAYCAAKAALNQLTRVLALEEPLLTVVALRPGMVDTDMQSGIRRQGPGIMPDEQVSFYQRMKDEGQLEPPLVPARVIAWLCLYAPREWSGEFLDYEDARISGPSVELFRGPA